MPSGIIELRDKLSILMDEIKDEVVSTHIASEITNAAGKILGTLKVELEYAALKKKEPNITFLEEAK